ncbi:hypothetical protein NDU88_003228 [Pleurodeles waltl]|uniref:Myb/SANT-like DNA-binding domain-containing protein n=1 Tax=Pleurodeles waltl TaxID=8319 RepID=A0AAV7WS92_PLEWA|nr:hypothetical protein NDU88_003228 [Pleurodeles waltl]
MGDPSGVTDSKYQARLQLGTHLRDCGPVQSIGEDLHCMCCCDLCRKLTMTRVTGERAPAFTSEELERLVDGVLPRYGLLYGLPGQLVIAHQKKGIWRAITKDMWTLRVYGRESTHCHKRWEDLRSWAWKTAEAQLRIGSQQGRGARRTLTPLMARILAVAYAELDGRMRASQQPQGASSGGGEGAPATEGAASHMTLESESTDAEGTSGTEGEESTTAETGGDNTDSDTSSDGSSLVVADTSLPTPAAGTSVTMYEHQAPQALPQGALLP